MKLCAVKGDAHSVSPGGDCEFFCEQPFDGLISKIAELEASEPMRKLRNARNQKLKMSDWTQGADVPDAIKTAWTTYRQQLRDLPKTASPSLDSENALDNSSVNWPEEPS